MGELVEFPSNGHTGRGYLALPADGSGPGLVVIQEWWGLVPHIQEVCDRFAGEGFVALAPDLYLGETTTEPDEAGKLMMALNLEQASKDMSGAVDYLLGHDAVSSKTVGVTGFCMGGGLALKLAADRPDAVSACVPFYGLIPWENAQPEWSKLAAAVLGHYAANDSFFTPEQARSLEDTLRSHGKTVEIIVHDDVDHAFFNDHRPEVHDPGTSARAFEMTVQFLRDNIN
jgi:carboxymethylenebutenolidase